MIGRRCRYETPGDDRVKGARGKPLVSRTSYTQPASPPVSPPASQPKGSADDDDAVSLLCSSALRRPLSQKSKKGFLFLLSASFAWLEFHYKTCWQDLKFFVFNVGRDCWLSPLLALCNRIFLNPDFNLCPLFLLLMANSKPSNNGPTQKQFQEGGSQFNQLQLDQL